MYVCIYYKIIMYMSEYIMYDYRSHKGRGRMYRVFPICKKLDQFITTYSAMSKNYGCVHIS